MGIFDRLFGGKKRSEPPPPSSVPPRSAAAPDGGSDEPFLEHPTGEHPSAEAAMRTALERLFALPDWSRPARFEAQGRGSHEDAYEFKEVQVHRRTIDLGEYSVDAERVAKAASLRPADVGLTATGSRIELRTATLAQEAAFLDALFRHGLGITPFESDEGDYAIGVYR